MTYVASRIKRSRATAAEMEQRRVDLYEIVEAGYAKVQRTLVDMRRAGELPWRWITDNLRYQQKPRSYRDPEAALLHTAALYRKALWADADAYVEVWLEKDALSGVVYPVTAAFDVPLMVARGYASLSFIHSAAEDIAEITDDGRPAHIYHLGDYDPSGVDAANKIEDGLRQYAPAADIQFHRLAVLPWQLEAWNLPTRPTKKSDTRAKQFGELSVELDAVDPNRLRSMVQEAIERHLPAEQYRVLREAEASERELLRAWANCGGPAA